MASPEYPGDLRAAGLSLFASWFGAHYARSTRVEQSSVAGDVLEGTMRVGRQWRVAFCVANTLRADADSHWERARAAVERRLDEQGTPTALFVPRRASIPSQEPGLSELAVAVDEASEIGDGRLEVRLPATIHLRRSGTTGSVITVLGGLSGEWAQFTNRVPGTFQLDSRGLHRLPASEEERTALLERVVNAANQPDIDETQAIEVEDVWTAVRLDDGERSVVFGTPEAESDEASAALRRDLRRLLRQAHATLAKPGDARALVIIGAATYAEDEKISWALRGMDPALYAGYDIIAVVADGVVKRVLEPQRASLPWDAPLA